MTPARQRVMIALLEARWGKRVAAAFAAAMREANARIDITALVRAITNSDIEGAVAAMHIAEATLRPFQVEVQRAFEDAGRSAQRLFPRRLRDANGMAVRLSFDVTNPRAEAFLRGATASFVTETTAQQRENVRSVLADYLAEGVNPRTAALRIAGRINRATGRREGGVLSLSSQQVEWRENARHYLSTGDNRYFSMSLRDRRYDSRIRAAIDAGRPVPARVIDDAIVAYANRAARLRAQTVAQTETLNALRGGKHIGELQAIDQADIPADLASKIWRHSGKAEPREDHQFYAGTAVPMNEPYHLPSGAYMNYPGDTSLGAGAADIVRCGCYSETDIDFIAVQARREKAVV